MLIDFPLEIVYEIFLHAAQSSTSSCRALCEVSAWVRHLALPYLYTSVPSRAIETIITLRPVCSPSPGFKPAEAVRGIWAPEDDVEWTDIMEHCTELSYLAARHKSLDRLAKAMNDGSRKDLRIGTNNLHILMLQNPHGHWSLHGNPSDTNHHFFRRITHLRLEDPAELHDIVFTHMPCLTHLAIPCSFTAVEYLRRGPSVFDEDTLAKVLAFVLVMSHGHIAVDKCQGIEDLVCNMRNNGANGVYLVRPLYDELQQEWDAEVRGGTTIWERAEKHTQWLMDCRAQSKTELAVPAGLSREIIRKVLLYAAQSSTSSCRTLCEVSTWVRHLVLPLLCRTVMIQNSSSLAAFDRLISSAPACPPTPGFHHADTVRHLWFHSPSYILESILRRCDKVTHLGFDYFNLLQPTEATISRPPTHQVFPVDAGEHVGVGELHIIMYQDYCHNLQLPHDPNPYASVEPHPLFMRITHLRLGNSLCLRSGVPISQMPRLTHVAMPCPSVEERVLNNTIFNVFTDTSKLEVFVLVIKHGCPEKTRRAAEDWVYNSRREEQRIYTVREIYSNIELEWDAEVRGGATVWERAVDHTQLLMSRYKRRRYEKCMLAVYTS